MTARWDRLPAGARTRAPRRKPAQIRNSYYCLGSTGCGALLAAVTYDEAEKHADAHGGHRLEIRPEGTSDG